jgi:predicted Zn finger-like uncharacterized protein
MILTCPACATRYQTDEAKFPPEGRQVRCAKCSHVWHQARTAPEAPPPEAPPEPPAAAVPEPEPAPPEPMARAYAARPALSQQQQRQPFLPMLAVVLGWIGLIAVVLLIGLSAVRYRQEISVIWPQSAGVYSSLGMNVNAHGIDFTDVDYHRESEDGQVVLAVTGRIVNKGSRELPVPQDIRVTLSDASNHELYHWNFAPAIQTLKAGQSSVFRTRLSNPPATARHLEVRFAKDDK